MKILVASDGSPDARTALTYGIGKALETRGELTVLHMHQRRRCRAGNAEQRGSNQTLQDSLRCFDAVRASIHDHGSGVQASAVFMTINDQNDILTYVPVDCPQSVVYYGIFKYKRPGRGRFHGRLSGQ
jgi:hypothetical protein